MINSLRLLATGSLLTASLLLSGCGDVPVTRTTTSEQTTTTTTPPPTVSTTTTTEQTRPPLAP